MKTTTPTTTPKPAAEVPAKKEQKTKGKSFGNVIMDLGMLLVVLSIAYSTYRILTGTSSIVSWIFLIPQACFAAYILVKQFVK